MLLPTRGEGMPLAVIEAMMCGRPVITTDAGGNLEILDTGVNGWVADAATSLSFGKILEQAWTVLPEWKNIGIAAHVRALKLVKDDPAGRLIQLLQRITSPNN
jgi:glycosyltransferase involved in cell wall biosynthesis